MANRRGQGRKPTPTPLKLLAGNPGKRSIGEREPQPGVRLPAPPRHLSAEAKREWKRTGRELLALGLMTEIDKAALAIYCQAWGRWVEAETALRTYGIMVRSPGGIPMQSPYLAVANKAMEQMRSLLAEFGLSPSSRTRLHVEPARELDPLEELRQRGRDRGA